MNLEESLNSFNSMNPRSFYGERIIILMDQKSFKYSPTKETWKTKQQLDNTTQPQNKLHLPDLNSKKKWSSSSVEYIFLQKPTNISYVNIPQNAAISPFFWSPLLFKDLG